jgi:hypothetical protein
VKLVIVISRLISLQAFTEASKLWMMKGQLELTMGRVEDARASFTEGGVTLLKFSAVLWIRIRSRIRNKSFRIRIRAALIPNEFETKLL